MFINLVYFVCARQCGIQITQQVLGYSLLKTSEFTHRLMLDGKGTGVGANLIPSFQCRSCLFSSSISPLFGMHVRTKDVYTCGVQCPITQHLGSPHSTDRSICQERQTLSSSMCARNPLHSTDRSICQERQAAHQEKQAVFPRGCDGQS